MQSPKRRVLNERLAVSPEDGDRIRLRNVVQDRQVSPEDGDRIQSPKRRVFNERRIAEL
jgi:hypothetical protein